VSDGLDDGVVDLRSDTVTRPTPEMRRAMATAEVGDDGYGEDPTVRRLEAFFAERVGKAAALFVPSGTMANQIALRVLAPPGSAVVAGRRQHLVAYELGAGARNASVQFKTVDDTTGMLDPAAVGEARADADYHQPEVSLVCTEDTHMASGGVPWDMAALAEVVAAAGGVPVHVDGARLFNAEVATGVAAASRAAPATTVMACLSKGLGAPVGSVLAGPVDVIDAARFERKRLGGAMRQSGIVAAAGLVGLRTMVDRLAEDHVRARTLALAVAERYPDAGCDPGSVVTNIVVFRPPAPEELVAHLASHGVRAGMIAPGVVRLMTHHDVDDGAIARACRALSTAPGGAGVRVPG
jgi:threonine aldolase